MFFTIYFLTLKYLQYDPSDGMTAASIGTMRDLGYRRGVNKIFALLGCYAA
jgi:hypothetical protein